VAVAVGVRVGRLWVVVSVVLNVGRQVRGDAVAEVGVPVRVDSVAVNEGEKVLLHERVQEPLRYPVPVPLQLGEVRVTENVPVSPMVAVSVNVSVTHGLAEDVMEGVREGGVWVPECKTVPVTVWPRVADLVTGMEKE